MTDVRCHCGRLVGRVRFTDELLVYLKLAPANGAPAGGDDETLRHRRMVLKAVRHVTSGGPLDGMVGPVGRSWSEFRFHCSRHPLAPIGRGELTNAARTGIREVRLAGP